MDEPPIIDEPIAAEPALADHSLSEPAAVAPARSAYRHRLPTRLWHWLNALSVFVMLMSGFMIFNAHPHLYWGQYGANFDHPWLTFQSRPFPGWATIPSGYNLAAARRWHLAFAWLLVLGLIAFLIVSLINRHAQSDLAPTRDEVRPSHIWHDISAHARLQFPTGEAALRYNILQKLSYVGVIFVLLPLMVLTGLTMSPGMDAILPWLVDLFGGRQSATIHFIAAGLMVLFVFVHVAMVLLAGFETFWPFGVHS